MRQRTHRGRSWCQESEHRHDGDVAIAALIAVALAALPASCNQRALSPGDAGGVGQVGIDGATDAMTDRGFDTVGADVARDTSADGVFADGGGDAGGDAGAIACGGMSCTGTDLCVTFDLCGGPANCTDLPASNVCPPGTTYYATCPPGNRPGCMPNCSPSYGCARRPTACNATLDCTCAMAACNGMGTCVFASGRGVLCANQ